jgi:hypothetical protein
MEYRETPRITSNEAGVEGIVDEPGSGPRPRLRRFEFVRSQRQLDLPRILVAVLLGLLALGLLSYLALAALHQAMLWVHRQPDYALPFGEIQLIPEPPAWFRGGSAGFLKQVQENAGEPEVLPVLDLERGATLDRSRIARAFKVFPWVDDVTRIEYPPHAIRVHLAYKTPVATIPYKGAEPALLDRKGHLLSSQNVDLEQLEPLILIMGQKLAPASSNRPGTPWRSNQPAPEAERIERGVRGAAQLAGFFHDRLANEPRPVPPALRVQAIVASDRRGLWVQNAEQEMILWGEPPGDEPIGAASLDEKWEMLKAWARNAARKPLPAGDYWAFGRSELRPVETRSGH